MRDFPPALVAYLEGQTASLALLFHLERTDGKVFAFTSHDADIEVAGLIYHTGLADSPSTIAQSDRLDVDNLELAGVLDAEALEPVELSGGLFDYAAWRVLVTDWRRPELGAYIAAAGTLGEIVRTPKTGMFQAELRGLAAGLQQQIGEKISPTCRATLGDARCTVDLSAHTHAGTVSTVLNGREFTTDDLGAPDHQKRYGVLKWTSGGNAGLSVEVKRQSAAGDIALFLPMPRPLAVGDLFEAVSGCDGRIETCHAVFDNVVNFRGEPRVPGNDSRFRFGGQ